MGPESGMSREKNDRRVRSALGKNFQGWDERIGAASFAAAVAAALKRQYGGRGGIKTVVGLTTANERAVRNWFDGRNGPSGEFLVALCRHSDEVLETVLMLAGRSELVAAKKLADAKDKLRQMLALIDELQDPPSG
jgi:hypothetical protein